MAVTSIPPVPFDMHHEDQTIRLHCPAGSARVANCETRRRSEKVKNSQTFHYAS